MIENFRFVEEDSIEKPFVLIVASQSRWAQKTKSAFIIDLSKISNSFIPVTKGLIFPIKISIQNIRFVDEDWFENRSF